MYSARALSAFTFVISILLFASVKSFAAENVAIHTSYAFPYTVSDFQGCQMALAKAKSRALEKVCGTFISGGSSRFKNEEIDSLNLFFFEMVGGVVTAYDVIDRNISILYSDQETGNYKECRIDSSISVACDLGMRDSSFATDFPNNFSLNETLYRDGDDFQINLNPSSDMYVFVFQYSPYINNEDNVFLVYPNDIDKDNFINKGKELEIPSRENSHKYKLVAELPKGKSLAAEAIMAVALKKNAQFPKSMSVEKFHNLLSQIPLDQRREAMVSYEIIQREGND